MDEASEPSFDGESPGAQSSANGRHPKLRLLTFGVLAGPVGWVVQFLVSYSAAATLCQGPGALSFYVVALLAFVLACLGFWAARREWIDVGRPLRTESSRGANGTAAEGRVRFLVLAGMLISAFFMVLIVIQALPIFFLEPCG